MSKKRDYDLRLSHDHKELRAALDDLVTDLTEGSIASAANVAVVAVAVNLIFALDRAVYHTREVKAKQRAIKKAKASRRRKRSAVKGK